MRQGFPWRNLPQDLQEDILQGGVGKQHLLGMAQKALTHPAACSGSSGEEFRGVEPRRLGLDLALAAWEHDMLDGGLAAQLLNLGKDALASRVLTLLAEVTGHYEPPENMHYLLRLLGRRETDKAFAYLERQGRDAPGNLFWLQQIMGLAIYEGRFDIARRRLTGVRPHCPDTLTPLLDGLEADLAVCEQDLETAATRYEQAARAGTLVSLSRLAEVHLRTGRGNMALDLIRRVRHRRPWNVNLLLKLHDLEQGVADDMSMPFEAALGGGRVAVLLYTWNKARELAQTLEHLEPALAAAPRGEVLLVVLDNGSSDGTAALLQDWSKRLGETMEVVTLPVNVGAPAARNWLIQHPSVRQSRWIAYLDDDALPPPDWLGRLGAAVRRYPDAGVWGCRILDAGNPLLIQKADLHLREPRQDKTAEGIAPSYPRRFSISNIHSQVLDMGQFSYMRPCGLVTGCVHLFRRRVLDTVGGFDLRFSPSQYDDVAHDIRLGLHGLLPVYQGHLAVKHLQLSGRAGHVTASKRPGTEAADNSREASLAGALGNMYKLQMLYTGEQLAKLRETIRLRLLEDVLAKQELLLEP